MDKDFYIVDNILGVEELLWLYHKLLDTPNWSLTRSSLNDGAGRLAFTGFPGLEIQSNETINIKYLSGYFQSIIFRLKKDLKNKYNLYLPNKIKRIHIGAKSSNSKTFDHVDSTDTSDWTILGFLNPVWDQNDGGELMINDKKLDYKPGRFVIFKSNTKHNGGFVKNDELNYWRITCNIIITR